MASGAISRPVESVHAFQGHGPVAEIESRGVSAVAVSRRCGVLGYLLSRSPIKGR